MPRARSWGTLPVLLLLHVHHCTKKNQNQEESSDEDESERVMRRDALTYLSATHQLWLFIINIFQ